MVVYYIKHYRIISALNAFLLYLNYDLYIFMYIIMNLYTIITIYLCVLYTYNLLSIRHSMLIYNLVICMPKYNKNWNSFNCPCHEPRTKSNISTLINNMYDCKTILPGISRSAFALLRVGFYNLYYDLYIKNCVR